MENDVIIMQIKAVLEEAQPFIARDGGRIDFVSYQDGIVEVSLHGACQACPMSLITLKWGLEEQIRARVPEIKEVRATTV